MDSMELHFDDKVAETLLIPLYMRARESERDDALFDDRLSRQLVERIDYDFSAFASDKLSSTGVAVRTLWLDAAIEGFVARNPNPVIVLIGCGLDPRFQRLKLDRPAVCYELDLPEVIDIRRRLIPESDDDIYIGASALDIGWQDELRERHPDGNFIFVCEGVLMYFEPQQVADLVRNMAQRFPLGELYFERMGTLPVRNGEKHPSVKRTQARFKWGEDDPKAVEKWAPNIRLTSEFYFVDAARRRWGFVGFIMRMIPALHRSCGIWGYRFDRP